MAGGARAAAREGREARRVFAGAERALKDPEVVQKAQAAQNLAGRGESHVCGEQAPCVQSVDALPAPWA